MTTIKKTEHVADHTWPKRRRVQKHFTKPSRTDQSHQSSCDIDVIIRKHAQTGLLTHVNRHHGDYSDFSNLPQSYHDSFNQVLLAQESFNSLPALIRKRFDNDPGLFLTFVGDPANAQEMVNLGLAIARPVVSSEANIVCDEVAVSA